MEALRAPAAFASRAICESSSPPGSVEASSTRLRDGSFLFENLECKEPGLERMASEHITLTLRWLRGRRYRTGTRCFPLSGPRQCAQGIHVPTRSQPHFPVSYGSFRFLAAVVIQEEKFAHEGSSSADAVLSVLPGFSYRFCSASFGGSKPLKPGLCSYGRDAHLSDSLPTSCH